MQNLINAIAAERKQRLQDFIVEINNVPTIEGLKTWQYTDLLPKGKNVKDFSFTALKAYLITRKEKAVYKDIERQVSKIKAVFNAGELIDVKVSIEWKRSQMWGNNPKAEAWCTFKDANGNTREGYSNEFGFFTKPQECNKYYMTIYGDYGGGITQEDAEKYAIEIQAAINSYDELKQQNEGLRKDIEGMSKEVFELEKSKAVLDVRANLLQEENKRLISERDELKNMLRDWVDYHDTHDENTLMDGQIKLCKKTNELL